MEKEVERQQIPAASSRNLHIKKRVLKNKALAVSFDEKDLRNYVTGFQKRKKKRRKVALQQQGEALRRKRIEARKKRKLERDFVSFGGAPPVTDSAPDGSEEHNEEEEEDEDNEPIPSVSGTTIYDNGDLQVSVTTSEITREDDIVPNEKIERPLVQPIVANQKHKVPVAKRKPMKRVVRHKSKSKSKSEKRGDKTKGSKRKKSKNGR